MFKQDVTAGDVMRQSGHDSLDLQSVYGHRICRLHRIIKNFMRILIVPWQTPELRDMFMTVRKVMVFIFLILIAVHVLVALTHPLTIAVAFSGRCFP